MQEIFEKPGTPQSKPRTSSLTLLVAVVAVAAVLAALLFLFEQLRGPRGTATEQAVYEKMSLAEREYVKKIEIGNIVMSRAENFIHQEVTTLSGEVYNGGTEPVAGLILTTEFSDDMKQIVLRDTRRILRAANAPLTPGERRAFEISFDHVPNSWNMQAPAVRVSYLQLSAQKR